jgi:hypothetical protein
VAFVTTAPEGSVTCPRKVPVVADDWVDDCACADAGADAISIAQTKFARMTTDKYFNTHLILSAQITLIENMD